MPTYKILTLGDSVMWGQGLQRGQTFAQLVANQVAGTGPAVDLVELPHSGAVACLSPTPSLPFDAFLYGELPRSFPSISSQLEIAGQAPGYASFLQPNSWDPPSWQAAKRSLQTAIAGFSGPGGKPPDLILVDGGINDLGALQIVMPWDLDSPDPCVGQTVAAAAAAGPPGGTVANVMKQLAASGGDLSTLDASALPALSDAKLQQLIDKYVYDRMRSLVGRLAVAFPTSRVIVTGYFPIFTTGSMAALQAHPAAVVLAAHRSNQQETRAALSLAMSPGLDRVKFANQVVHQSTVWYQYGTARLRAVVDEANLLHGNRFALASPAFGDDNGALAPDALLWTFSSIIDDILQDILDFWSSPAKAAPMVAMAAPQDVAAAAASVFGGWGAALAFLVGIELGSQIATDQVIDARVAAAKQYYFSSPTGRSDPENGFVTGLKAGFASIGHPNIKGAQTYLKAIEPLLP